MTSVKKTGRVLFLNEDTEVTNFGEHLARRVTEKLFGLADTLEAASVWQQGDVEKAMRELATMQP